MEQSNISKQLNFIVPSILASSTIPYIIVKPTHTHNPLSMHFVGFFSFYTRKNEILPDLSIANKTCPENKQTLELMWFSVLRSLIHLTHLFME